MNHYANIAAALEAEHLDAVLLTGEANRFYATGFFIPGGDATALVTRKDAVSTKLPIICKSWQSVAN